MSASLSQQKEDKSACSASSSCNSSISAWSGTSTALITVHSVPVPLRKRDASKAAAGDGRRGAHAPVFSRNPTSAPQICGQTNWLPSAFPPSVRFTDSNPRSDSALRCNSIIAQTRRVDNPILRFSQKINRPNRKLFPNFRARRLTNAKFVIQ